MCGVAGYSFASGTEVDFALVTRLLLAGLAERGEDACGYAWRIPGATPTVVKQPLPPLSFLTTIDVKIPAGAREGMIHIRDFTKGRPAHHGNNHPIIHGAVTGIHNGIIQNDDELFVAQSRERALPGMTVDSEAVFMLLDALDGDVQAVARELVGSYCAMWFDDRRPDDGLFVLRGRARPLAVATGPGFTLVASTTQALQFALDGLGLHGRIRKVTAGTTFQLIDGEIVHQRRIRVTPFREARTFSYTWDIAHAVAARAHLLAHLRSRHTGDSLPPAMGA